MKFFYREEIKNLSAEVLDMEYSHEDRLEAIRNLYNAVYEKRDFYDAKKVWEILSQDTHESYFWMALDDLYRNDLVDIENDFLEARESDLKDFELSEQGWYKEEFSRTTADAPWRAPVYTGHFRKHDDPDFELSYLKSKMRVERDVEKGDKKIVYTAQNGLDDELWIKLDVEFTVPDLSPEVEELFDSYAEDYMNRIWADEIETLTQRASEKTREPAI